MELPEQQARPERVLMALEPAWLELVFLGKKFHEFRKRFVRGVRVEWYCYLPEPVSRLAALIDLAPAVEGTPAQIAAVAEADRPGGGRSVRECLTPHAGDSPHRSGGCASTAGSPRGSWPSGSARGPLPGPTCGSPSTPSWMRFAGACPRPGWSARRPWTGNAARLPHRAGRSRCTVRSAGRCEPRNPVPMRASEAQVSEARANEQDSRAGIPEWLRDLVRAVRREVTTGPPRFAPGAHPDTRSSAAAVDAGWSTARTRAGTESPLRQQSGACSRPSTMAIWRGQRLRLSRSSSAVQWRSVASASWAAVSAWV